MVAIETDRRREPATDFGWPGTASIHLRRQAPGGRHVLITFGIADRDQSRQWSESPEYRDIAKHRLAAATRPVRGIHGFG